MGSKMAAGEGGEGKIMSRKTKKKFSMKQIQPIPMRSQRAVATTSRLTREFGLVPALQVVTDTLSVTKQIVQKNLNRALNLDKPLPAGGESVAARPSLSWLEFFLKIPVKVFNAAFTPMGRKNLAYAAKKSLLKLNGEFRAKGTLIYKLNDGSPFVLHRGNRLSELFYLEGAYEPLETLLVSKVVRPGDVVLDLGANVGYFTALLDRLVRPGGEVHSFEPGDSTFPKLEQTKKLLRLDQATLHRKAISNAVGEVDFWSSTSGLDAQQKTTNTPALSQELRLDRVAATTLDTLAAELTSRGANQIAFVKCDIEGAEPAMLKGAKKLLEAENPPVWLIEHNREALADHGCSSADLLKPFADGHIYFVPLCWPPSLMSVPHAQKWSGVADELPDECNLIILPTRGIFAKRAEALRQADLLS